VSFTLGVNYPWVSCGHDFGPRPPPWSGAGPNDFAAIERELRELRELGLTVVRWWILAGGVNLPVGVDPSTVATKVPFVDPWPRWRRALVRRRRTPPERWEPHSPLEPLPRAFLEDFERLLAACEAAGVQLVPSLVSFELFLPISAQAKGVTSRGRGAFALGERTGAFLDATLDPLLEVCERHRGAVAAFEIANEPGWAARSGGHGSSHGPHPPWASAEALATLLVEGARRVARRDLRATVGFVSADVPWLPASARVTLARLAARGAYVHQLHHYPRRREQHLPPADASPIHPVWVGELATSRERPWGDPGLAEDDPSSFLARRIELVKERGYDGALVWARHASDAQVRWDQSTTSQLRRAAERLRPS
jgi:hypothetical protein